MRIDGIDELSEITKTEFREYRQWREDEGGLNRISVKTQLDTLRVFIRWCEKESYVRPNLSRAIISPSRQRDGEEHELLESERAEQILEYLDKFEYGSVRHVTFQLLWRTAMRRDELVALDLRDYYPDDQVLRLYHRPDSNTGLPTGDDGERAIGIGSKTCEVIDA